MNLIPTSGELTVLRDLGTTLVRSGFLPESIKTPEQAVAIMLKGQELGIPPMQAFAQISIIKGKPAMSAELMLGMIYKNVPGVVVDYPETTDTKCVIVVKRPGGQPTKFTFTIEDARRAELLNKSTWKQYPSAMLRARAIAAMARAMFPDALMGVSYTPEELEGPEGRQEVPVTSEAVSVPTHVQTQALEAPIAAIEPTPEPIQPVNPIPSRNQIVTNRIRVLGWSDVEVRELIAQRYAGQRVDAMTQEVFADLLDQLEKGKIT